MGEHTYTEYGVMVDRTSAGHGYFLAETHRDLARAQEVVEKARIRFGFPATLKQREVTMTDWVTVRPSCLRPAAPSEEADHG